MSTRSRRGALLAAAALPWCWYTVRDAHAMLDWGAVLLPALVVGAVCALAATAALLRSAALLAVALCWASFGVAAVAAPWTPAGTDRPQEPLVLAAANVRGDNPSPGAVADDVLGLDADVLVVTELSPLQAEVAARLDDRYAHSVRAPADQGVGVWSDLPLTDAAGVGGADLRGARGVRVVVEAPQGHFALYALHLFRPSRHAFENELTMPDHRALVEALDARTDADDLPVVIAGDLNLTDRGGSFRTLAAGRVDALRSSWTGPTSLRARNRPLLLRIDHLLLPPDWCAADGERSRLTGSDHRAVSAGVGPC